MVFLWILGFTWQCKTTIGSNLPEECSAWLKRLIFCFALSTFDVKYFFLLAKFDHLQFWMLAFEIAVTVSNFDWIETVSLGLAVGFQSSMFHSYLVNGDTFLQFWVEYIRTMVLHPTNSCTNHPVIVAYYINGSSKMIRMWVLAVG